jgi:hypothetical protein
VSVVVRPLEVTLDFVNGSFVVSLVDEPIYSVRSVDDPRTYDREYDFTEAGYRASSRHGICCREPNGSEHSCILLVGGGASGIHERSAVIVGQHCFVAVGDMICSLALPCLELEWATKVDSATCFGVHYSADHECFLSHGELEIARVSLSGEIVWSGSGRDIFSEGFRVGKDWAEATDFGGNVYRFDIITGRCEEVPAEPRAAADGGRDPGSS